MNKKDVVMVLLGALCLTVALFSIIPVMSVPQYDPWKDLNENGAIDAKEYQLIKNAIPSTGNPAKPVVMGGYYWDQDYFEIVLLPFDEGAINVTTAGYEQITLGFKASPLMPPPFGNVTVVTGFLLGNSSSHVYLDRFNVTAGWAGGEPPILPEYSAARTYDIRGQTLTIAYYNPNQVTYTLTIEFYRTT